jgi:photosystem II stability/assembly factor-like uncharacterized protein
MVGLFVSTDGGGTWQHRGWREYIRTFYTEAGPGGAIWSACGNGVLRSTDGGAGWVITTGWEVTEVLKVRSDPLNPARVFAATAYGVYRTTDGGKSWLKLAHGGSPPFTADVLLRRGDPSCVLLATEDGVYRSDNGGDNWERSGLDGKGIRMLFQSPGPAGMLWAGTEDDGIYASSDRGRTWASRSTGLEHRTVYTVCTDPASPDTLYAGTHGGGVYRSRDGGATWGRANAGLTSLEVHALVALPSSPRTILAGTLNGGLFRSTDGGEHWEFNSQPEAQVWGLSVR